MKKILFITALLFVGGSLFAQETGNFFGGFESNSQWLLYDSGLNFTQPNEAFRANNYFQLNYSLGKFTAGAQYESYLPSALLGYSPVYDGNNGIATYYLNYKDEKIDVTGGFFYEQFGSGLILRAWEDRQLGINNAMKGIRVKFHPFKSLDVTALYGQQRNGFETSSGTMTGIDTNFDIAQAFQIENMSITLGASYVSRYQDTNSNNALPKTVQAVGGRLDIVSGSFYGGIEAISKSKDVITNEGQIVSNKLYDGTAMLVNLGYAKKGLGVSYTFRRLENFSFYSDRLAEGNVYNQQVLNYVPALTKQQDYLLTNIYVYNSQPRLIIESYDQRSGEVGNQIDLYYKIKKGTFLGGKYGTKIAANFSYWGALDAEYNVDNKWYKAKFIGSGQRLYRDINLEIKKRWSKNFSTVATYQNVIINKTIVYGGPINQKDFYVNVGVIEGTQRFNKGKSLRLVLQHLWTKEDNKNWAGGVLEYNFNSTFALYAADSYNYGGEGETHYYNFGGSYTKGNTRLGLNYGRQRGGLICVGGVCRFVPENTGLSANLTVTF